MPGCPRDSSSLRATKLQTPARCKIPVHQPLSNSVVLLFVPLPVMFPATLRNGIGDVCSRPTERSAFRGDDEANWVADNFINKQLLRQRKMRKARDGRRCGGIARAGGGTGGGDGKVSLRKSDEFHGRKYCQYVPSHLKRMFTLSRSSSRPAVRVELKYRAQRWKRAGVVTTSFVISRTKNRVHNSRV